MKEKLKNFFTKAVIFFAGAILLGGAGIAFADRTSEFWLNDGSSLTPNPDTLTLGASTTPIAIAHFTQISTGRVIGTSTATSTFAGGVNLTGGCFAIGGTCLPSSGISGTGAANKLAYFTSASAQSYNDLLHWDNTNVRLGVGSSSPYAKLSVGSNTGGTGPLFAVASSTAGGATSTYAWIDAFGNFGIGTTTPGQSALFGVNGAGFFGGALYSSTLDTGFGANELYDMNQNVQTTDSPTFNALTLTTALTRANGGMGTTTWQTGSVAFAGATYMTEDNTNLYWDDTNNRLGIGGTTTPQRTLSVAGPMVSAECNLTDGATVTFNLASCNQGKVVLGGNRALDFTNETQALGQGIRVVVCQDGTGSRTLTHDSAVRWAGGTAPTLTTTANKCDVLAGFTSVATGTPIIMLDKVLSF